MELYWTVVVTLMGGAWAMLSWFRDQKKQAIEDSRAIIGRVLETDRLSIEHPEIRRYLSTTALEDEDFFRDAKRLEEDVFFTSKSFVYFQLNLFDEILSVSTQTGGIPTMIPQTVIEMSDWEEYIKHVMAHPLSRSILNKEHQIFGQAMRDFWEQHRSEIYSRAPDPYSW